MTMDEKNSSGIGAAIASLIIVLVLLAGGYFAWQSSVPDVNQDMVPQDGSYIQPVGAITPPLVPPQESTEISDISADVAALDLSPLDTGLENLDLLVQ